MSIASEIQRINTNIANAYTAADGKGATMPVTQNSANLATCIGSISGGGSFVGLNREVVYGKYSMPTTSFTFSLPSDATDLGQNAMYYAFYECAGLTSVNLSSLTTVSSGDAMRNAFQYCTGLTSVDLSSLTTVSGSSTMRNAFQYCAGLTSVNLSSLTTVSGGSAMANAFDGCAGLTSVDLSSLTTVSGGYAMSYAFYDCTGLTSVDLSSLTTVSGRYAMQNVFYSCTKLTTLSFPSLTSNSFGSYTNQFNNMLEDVTGCTVHFPSNLQSVIGSWSSVTSGFGGTNTTVLFDLPATERSIAGDGELLEAIREVGLSAAFGSVVENPEDKNLLLFYEDNPPTISIVTVGGSVEPGIGASINNFLPLLVDDDNSVYFFCGQLSNDNINWSTTETTGGLVDNSLSIFGTKQFFTNCNMPFTFTNIDNLNDDDLITITISIPNEYTYIAGSE